MTLKPAHAPLVTAADLSEDERQRLIEDYVDLEERLQRDGFRGAMVEDVLLGLVRARTSPRGLHTAARELEKMLRQGDLDAIRADDEDAAPAIRSAQLLVRDRWLRGADSRLRQMFVKAGVRDCDAMHQTVIAALRCLLSGKRVDEEALLAEASAATSRPPHPSA